MTFFYKFLRGLANWSLALWPSHNSTQNFWLLSVNDYTSSFQTSFQTSIPTSFQIQSIAPASSIALGDAPHHFTLCPWGLWMQGNFILNKLFYTEWIIPSKVIKSFIHGILPDLFVCMPELIQSFALCYLGPFKLQLIVMNCLLSLCEP